MCDDPSGFAYNQPTAARSNEHYSTHEPSPHNELVTTNLRSTSHLGGLERAAKRAILGFLRFLWRTDNVTHLAITLLSVPMIYVAAAAVPILSVLATPIAVAFVIYAMLAAVLGGGQR